MSHSFWPSHVFKPFSSRRRSSSQAPTVHAKEVPPLPVKDVDQTIHDVKKGYFWKKTKTKTQPPSPGSSTTCSASGCSSPKSLDEFVSDEEHAEACDASIVLEDVDINRRQWDRALSCRSAFELSDRELRQLVNAGVPEQYRLTFWAKSAATTPPHISSLNAVDILQARAPKRIASQIDLDLPRTQTHFLTAAHREVLGRLLRAYAVHNPSVGYCQGMNNLAAVFIRLGFDEACAFQCLCSLIDDCCPDYHKPDLCGLRRDALVLEDMVKHVLPAGSVDRLAALGVSLDVLMSEHFLCLASSAWPLEATVRLWDLIFLDKQAAVFASFLAILQLFLPSKSELETASGGLPGMPEETEEPLEIFRRNVQRGVVENLGMVLRTTQEIIQKLPQSLIEHFRADAAGKIH